MESCRLKMKQNNESQSFTRLASRLNICIVSRQSAFATKRKSFWHGFIGWIVYARYVAINLLHGNKENTFETTEKFNQLKFELEIIESSETCFLYYEKLQKIQLNIQNSCRNS